VINVTTNTKVFPRWFRALTASFLVAQLAVTGLATAQQMAPPDKSMQRDDMGPQLPAIRMAPPQQPTGQLDLGKTPLMNDEKVILHLLNRFTYGPRPGEVERVQSMGAANWLRQQLQPETIDDSAQDRRLASFPAMQLKLEDLMRRYPDEQTIRQTMNGRGNMPGGMAEKAIYNDQMERYRVRQEKKTGKDAGDDAMSSADKWDTDKLLADTPQNRFAFLCKLSIEDLRQLRQGMTDQQRQHLMDGFTPQQREAVAAFAAPRQLVISEVTQTKLLRDIYSERQLQEVMTDFWLNHFSVYMAKSGQAPYYIADYEKNVIRPRALGYFEDLLVATAESPAMLNYLDNAESIGPHSEEAKNGAGPNAPKNKAAGLNENYAREVMELHTVGVNGGYSQRDVTELAKVFTGWTIDGNNGKGARAVFNADKHEGGEKHVMDLRIKANGEKEGMQVLHMLATNPHTAHFVSQKLAVRFVSDNPSPALVERMAETFLRSNGNIRAVLATMVSSREFWSDANYHSKVKTPQDYVVSAVRAGGADVASASALAAALTQLGMPLYGMQTPNGYSMKADAWNNTASLVARLNFSLALASNRVNGVQIDWDAMLGTGGSSLTPAQKESVLEAKLLHIPVAPRTRDTILKAITGNSQQDAATLRQLITKYQQRDPLTFVSADSGTAAPLDPQAALAAGFLIGSPDFQRR
jgi:uncharacterized protein (DUF1800 family)